MNEAEKTQAQRIQAWRKLRLGREEKDRLLAAFHQIGQSVLASLNLEQMLDVLAEQIVRAGIFRSLMIALVDEVARSVNVVRSLRVYDGGLVSPDGIGVIGFRYDLDDDPNITAEVARTGEMQVIRGWDHRFDRRVDSPNDEVKISYFIPVKQQDRVLAVLATASEPEDKEEMLRRIEVMSPLLDQVAIALEHARLFQAVQASEKALLESKQRYELATRGGQVGVWEWNLEAQEMVLDPNLKAMLGYGDHEIWYHQADWSTLIHPADVEQVMAAAKACVEGQAPEYEATYRMVHKDGSLRWFLARGSVVRGPDGKAHGLMGTSTDITDRKRMEEELRASHEQLRALAARLEHVREEERTHIAREIHDKLGHTLTALKMDLAWLKRKVSDANNGTARLLLRERIATIEAILDTTIQTVREIASELRPGILDDFGLTAAIEWQVRGFERRTDIACTFAAAEEVTLDPERSTAMFRIFQEILTNVARHAHATSVNIRLEQEADGVVLEVRDNGRGITEREMSNANSLGILGMRERALAFGGEVSIRGVQGRGTTVTVRMPMLEGVGV